MVVATARFLRGRGFPVLGKGGAELLRPLLVGLNHLPSGARQWLYRVGSGREAIAPELVAQVDEERLASQVLAHYPPRRYAGALVGSTPGSAAHLATALGVPLLPQTVLLPLQHRGLSLDDPQGDVEVARQTVAALLERNPHVVVHQMADPTNDRLTLARFSYLRVKRTALGRAYEDFLLHHVAPGGTLCIVESRHSWPTTRVADRHVFQFGGVGGLEPDEYLHGGPRVAEFLAQQGSPRRAWSPPAPDGDRPEAEWGFEPELAEDVERFAAEHGFRVMRIAFDHADDLSPMVADLYRWWYRRLGRPTTRLFVESFVLLDPYWVLRAGAVPYWVTFNAEPGVRRLVEYLEHAEPYDVIEATMISNGTWTPGLAGPDRWRPVFDHARQFGRFAGVDPDRFPTDLAVFARYRDSLRSTRPRLPLPAPLTFDDFGRFVDGRRPGVGGPAVSVTRS